MARIVMPRSRSSGCGVHDQLTHLLVSLEDLALLQQGVDQGGLAVIDVGYDR